MNRLQPLRTVVNAAIAAAISLWCSPWAGHAQESANAMPHAKTRIVLAGDSTVTDKVGWGKGFADCLTDAVECINLSRAGRSSKSFVAEGSWQKVLALKPDYVLIQFGHNDQPGHGADIETDPETTYKQFMTRYVDEAEAAGIHPVLVTSLSRRQWGPDGKIQSTLVPWVEVVKRIAADKHVPLIDLHALSIAYYQREGKEKIFALSPVKTQDPAPPSPDVIAGTNKVYDGTHLNAKGGVVIGRMVADELKKAVPALAPCVKD